MVHGEWNRHQAQVVVVGISHLCVGASNKSGSSLSLGPRSSASPCLIEAGEIIKTAADDNGVRTIDDDSSNCVDAIEVRFRPHHHAVSHQRSGVQAAIPTTHGGIVSRRLVHRRRQCGHYRRRYCVGDAYCSACRGSCNGVWPSATWALQSSSGDD